MTSALMDQVVWEKRRDLWITQTDSQSRRNVPIRELQTKLGPAGPLVLALPLMCHLCSSPEKSMKGKKKSPLHKYLPLFFLYMVHFPCNYPALDDRLGKPFPLLGESQVVLWQSQQQFPACREGNQGIVISINPLRPA